MDYLDCINIVKEKVYPERLKKKENNVRIKWWQHARCRPNMHEAIKNIDRVLVIAQVSKTVAFSFVPNNQVLDTQLTVIATDQYFDFAVLQSNLHYNWAWKYCTTMKNDLRYVVQSVYETFPFPLNLKVDEKLRIEEVGEEFYVNRQRFMQKLKLGLTKTYNLFHQKDLSIDNVIKASKQPHEICESAYKDIIKLRELQKQMDEAVLQAYGWLDIDLAHDFYEVDYLPENDRIRYTISPEARKEVLKRLLKINHEIHEQELLEGKNKKGKSKKKTKPDDSKQLKLFQ